MKGLFGNHIQLTGNVLDLRLQRQNVVMANLANIKTPGYRARRLEFEKELLASLQSGSARILRTHEQHLPVPDMEGDVSPGMHREVRVREVQGKDSVDLDKEMAIMSKNTLLYNTLSTVLKKNFEGLNKIITQGGR